MALKVLKAFREGGVDYHPGDPAPKGLDPVTLTLLIKARHIYDPKVDPKGRGGFVGSYADGPAMGPEARIRRPSHVEDGLKVVKNPDFTDAEATLYGRSEPQNGVDVRSPSSVPRENMLRWGPNEASRKAEVAAQIAEVQRIDAEHRSGEVANQKADMTAQSKG